MIYKIKRTVVSGFKRGSKIGFPTLNTRLYKYDYKKISSGIWAAIVKFNQQSYPSVTFVGKTQSFLKNKNVIESHLISNSLNSTPQNIEILFIKKIREVRKFNSINSLREQIDLDIQKARQILKKYV